MSTAVSNPPLPDYGDLQLRKFLVYSLMLHAALLLLVGIGGYFKLFEGNTWSGVGGEQGGTNVKLVSSSGIPMPRPVIPTESRTVDPTQGLYKVDPPKLDQPPPDATKLPSFEKKKPQPPPRKSKILDSPKPPPDNAFYGKSGTPDIKSGYSQNPGSSSGVELKGQGGGDFASLYPAYVEALRNRISQNWDQTAIDSALRVAHRGKTTMTFRIARDGTISNIAMELKSGNNSLDYSAQRTLLSLGKVAPLPSGYRGSYVDVVFDFDLSLSQ